MYTHTHTHTHTQGEVLHKQDMRVMTLSCNQASGEANIYHHGSTSSNVHAGRRDSSEYLTHWICINHLIGLLPAASPVNNCWAGLRGTSGGITLYACHPVENNLLETSYREKETLHCLWGKGHFQDRDAFSSANQI